LNFGPEERSRTVREVLMIAQRAWKQPVDFEIDSAFEKSHDAIESIALDLNSSFAHSLLGWRPLWSQEDAVVASLNWWKEVLEGSMSAEISCQLDINHIDI
jgi:nucleoside-diphosphate-sugar epimerase